MLEMLVIVDEICRKNNIPYSLYGGTLLGAVRHQGFIPWDDDLDICLSRNNYNRLLSILEKELPDGYILQNKENTPASSNSFSKIRKLHTTFLEHKEDIGRFHTGIFIDIFPVDRAPNGRIPRFFFNWKCMQYFLYTREYAPPKAGLVVKTGCNLLLFFVKGKQREKQREKCLQYIMKKDDDPSCHPVGMGTLWAATRYLPCDILDNYEERCFEGKHFFCVAKAEDYLTTLYGDYMKLPPVEEQTWTHHPIILNFEHDVEELEQMKCLEL